MIIVDLRVTTNSITVSDDMIGKPLSEIGLSEALLQRYEIMQSPQKQTEQSCTASDVSTGSSRDSRYHRIMHILARRARGIRRIWRNKQPAKEMIRQ